MPQPQYEKGGHLNNPLGDLPSNQPLKANRRSGFIFPLKNPEAHRQIANKNQFTHWKVPTPLPHAVVKASLDAS